MKMDFSKDELAMVYLIIPGLRPTLVAVQPSQIALQLI